MNDQSKHVVCIAGKRNVDKLNDKLSDKLNDKLLTNPNKQNHQRSRSMKWTIDDAFFNYDKQLEVLRRLIADDGTLEERNFFKKEIKAKLDGYVRQDKENGMIDGLSAIISLDATIEMLLISKMRCAYCRECCELIYKDVMAPRQWTLDRVNNDRGHSGDNVVLACLACNLQRRTMDAERFKFGKQLRIVKGF